MILPSVSQCASPIFPASSSLHPAVVLGLPVKRNCVLSMRILTVCFPFYYPYFRVFPLPFSHPSLHYYSHLFLLQGFL